MLAIISILLVKLMSLTQQTSQFSPQVFLFLLIISLCLCYQQQCQYCFNLTIILQYSSTKIMPQRWNKMIISQSQSLYVF